MRDEIEKEGSGEGRKLKHYVAEKIHKRLDVMEEGLDLALVG